MQTPTTPRCCPSERSLHALWGWKCDKCAAMLFTLLRSPMMGQCEPHPPVLTSDARGWPVTNQRPGLRLGTNGSPSRVPGPAPTLRPETPESRRTGPVSGKHRPVHYHGHNVTRIVMRLHLTFKSVKHEKFMNPMSVMSLNLIEDNRNIIDALTFVWA